MNFDERLQLARYVRQAHLRTRLIVFCNKRKITNELLNRPEFELVTCNFGRILKHLHRHPVHQPAPFDETERRLQESFEKLQHKHKRISALKWSGVSCEGQEGAGNFEFLNVSEQTKAADIHDLQHSHALLWKDGASLCSDFSSFRRSLLDSLLQLQQDLKLHYSSVQLQDTISKMELPELLLWAKDFFESHHEFGLALNQALTNLENMSNKEMVALREFVVLGCLNFAAPLKLPPIGRLHLKRWASHKLLS